MTRDEARFLLQACGDEPVAESPEMVEALAMAANDPELADFLQAERTFDQEVSRQLEEATVPTGLREQLLELVPRGKQPSKRVRPSVLLDLFSRNSVRAVGSFAAAVIVVILLAVIFFEPREATADSEIPEFLQTIREEMLANEMPQEDGETLPVLDDFLSRNGAPSPAALPDSLSTLQPAGASFVEGTPPRKIGVIHLKDKSGDPFQLFIARIQADASSIPVFPDSAIKEFERIAILTWQREDKVHALVTLGPASTLETFRPFRAD